MSTPDVQHFVARVTQEPPPTADELRTMLDAMVATRLVAADLPPPADQIDYGCCVGPECPVCAAERDQHEETECTST